MAWKNFDEKIMMFQLWFGRPLKPVELSYSVFLHSGVKNTLVKHGSTITIAYSLLPITIVETGWSFNNCPSTLQICEKELIMNHESWIIKNGKFRYIKAIKLGNGTVLHPANCFGKCLLHFTSLGGHFKMRKRRRARGSCSGRWPCHWWCWFWCRRCLGFSCRCRCLTFLRRYCFCFGNHLHENGQVSDRNTVSINPICLQHIAWLLRFKVLATSTLCFCFGFDCTWVEHTAHCVSPFFALISFLLVSEWFVLHLLLSNI